MLIHVLQGERDRAKDNWSLGRFAIEFAPAPKGVPRVGVQFEIDADGILHVLARDIKTGQQTIVQMKSAVDVADSEVEKMVEQSVEHAFDDMKARQWIEEKTCCHRGRCRRTFPGGNLEELPFPSTSYVAQAYRPATPRQRPDLRWARFAGRRDHAPRVALLQLHAQKPGSQNRVLAAPSSVPK